MEKREAIFCKKSILFHSFKIKSVTHNFNFLSNCPQRRSWSRRRRFSKCRRNQSSSASFVTNNYHLYPDLDFKKSIKLIFNNYYVIFYLKRDNLMILKPNSLFRFSCIIIFADWTDEQNFCNWFLLLLLQIFYFYSKSK